jgi:hypothetical protein
VEEGTVYGNMEVMKMILPLTILAPGTLTWKLTEGALVQVGDVLARVALDDPSQVEAPVAYQGDDFFAYLSPQTSKQVFSTSSVEVSQLLGFLGRQERTILTALSGYALPSSLLFASFQSLLEGLKNPLVPVLQVEEVVQTLMNSLPSH